jgi:hypothetical protein
MIDNKYTKIQEIGFIGENIIFNLLKTKEHEDVLLSEDKFDSIKDMTASGLSVEVKTQVLIKKYQAFVIGSSQIVKCINADRLFFNEISRDNVVRVWESLKPRRPSKKFFNGDTCYFFKLTDLKLYDIINDVNLANRLRELSPSKYI